MSTGPLILAALARVRCREALPARISLSAYLHLIVRRRSCAPLWEALKMHAQHLRARPPSPHFHELAKTLKELLCGRRKALLIGIQNPTETEEVVEECAPASVTAVESAAGPSPIASMPRAPRKKGHKTKKAKGASRGQAGETDALKGPHHDVQAMYDLLISASTSIMM